MRFPSLSIAATAAVLASLFSPLAVGQTRLGDLDLLHHYYGRSAHGADRELNGRLLFSDGQRLWSTDGTPAGTAAIYDVGEPVHDIGAIVVVGGVAVFHGTHPVFGHELYVSDGTPGGTRLLVDIHPTGSSAASHHRGAAGRCFFGADDGRSGRELWQTDGTAAGTGLVADLTPGAGSSTLDLLGEVGGRLLFLGPAAWSTRDVPYTSDGTAAGTAPLAAGLVARSMPTFSDRHAFFEGWQNGVGHDVWQTDGTSAGTFPITSSLRVQNMLGGRDLLWLTRDVNATPSRIDLEYHDPRTGTSGIVPNVGSLYPRLVGRLTAGRIAIRMSDPVVGTELFACDEANPAAAPVLLIDATPGSGSTIRMIRIGELGNDAFYVLETATPDGYVLVATDGTPPGTRVLARQIAELDLMVRGIGRVGGRLVFVGWDPVFEEQAWVTDGTVAGTHRLAVLEDAGGGLPRRPQLAGRRVVFEAAGGLWSTDGTPAGTYEFRLSSWPSTAVASDATHGLYLTGYAAATGKELWWSDGTLASAQPIADIHPGSGWSSPRDGAFVGDLCVFSADDGVHGQEPWVTDGTAAGTRLLLDLHPGGSSDPLPVARLRGRLVFLADDGTHGRELWVTDGTAGGTRLLADLVPGPDRPRYVRGSLELPPGDWTTIVLSEPIGGEELWRTDGTSAGTFRLGDFAPGGQSSAPAPIAWLGDRLVFAAITPATGYEPWITDGTVAGTVPIADLAPGQASSIASGVGGVSLGDRVMFTAAGTDGPEPWITDGTAAGTRQIDDLWPGPAGSRPRSWVRVGDRHASFTAFLPEHGTEIWWTDGTAAGTRMAFEIGPGAIGIGSWVSDQPSLTDFAAEGEPFTWFVAADGAGPEPWVAPLTRSSDAPWRARHGLPCAATAAPRVDAQRAPRLGDPSFAIDVEQGPASSPAVLLVGGTLQSPALGGGCALLPTSPPWIDVGLVLGPSGAGSLAVPVPNSTNLLHLRIAWQVITLRSGGALLGLAESSDVLLTGIGR